jgi:cation/acetate symporter
MISLENQLPIIFFFMFVALTLAITYWAARQTKTPDQFFAADGQISAWQNGWALAGDFLSAGALLGIAGIVTLHGFDGLVYSIGWMVGWPIMLFLIVEPLRNVGKYTMGDLIAYRLQQRWVRSATAVGSLAVILFYLIAQMVATGSLIKLLFGLPYPIAVIIVGAAMLIYVLFGGMIATTWVQVVKAALLVVGVTILSLLTLRQFDWSLQNIFAAAVQKYGEKILQPGSEVLAGEWEAISLGLALMFGTAAMPHVLMRIYTVRDLRESRLSIAYATAIIGFFHLLVFIIGFGAMVIVGPQAVLKAGGGGNMAAPLLALAVGGNAFFGFICAVAFATMLAVVAGLTLSGVATLSHDVWANVIRQGHASQREQLVVARGATVVIAVLAIVLGVAFEGQNVAFMAGLAFSIACSANFPVLVLAIMWKRLTTPGAVASILVGTVMTLLLICLSATVQVDVLGKPLTELQDQWWFVPIRNPALFSMPLSFLFAILVSLCTTEKDADIRFDEMRRKIIFGKSAPAA